MARPRLQTRGFATAVALTLFFGAASAWALPVTPTFNWRASAPGTDPTNEWNATIGSHQWSVSGASQGVPSSSYTPITGAYDFSSGDTATGVSFQGIASGNPSNEDVSLELWFRPNDLSGGQQVLFETGGGVDGLSILLNDDVLSLRVKDGGNDLTLSHTLPSAPSDFVQVAITLALDSTAELWVDGVLEQSGSASGINDWTGSNGSGIGSRNGNVGGNIGGDLNAYGSFQGEIALFRFYRNQVLTGAQVQQNFDAIATPEPGTAVLVALGLAGLAARRRPRR